MKQEEAEVPNILVLMSDQHSRVGLGCYEQTIVRTPHLDALARDGMIFQNAYCPAPLCVPSRMSFLTSQTPTNNEVWGNSNILSSAIPTWAHVLGAKGYDTNLIGRMHFVGPDQRHGFEHRPLGEFSARAPGTVSQGATKYPTGQSRGGLEEVGTGRTTYQWFDEQVMKSTIDFLKEYKGKKDKKPFAVVSGFVLPHCPFIAPKELFDYYYENLDNPKVEGKLPETIKRFRRHRKIDEPVVPVDKVRAARAAYFALCELFDSYVGKIMQTLDDCGLRENTLVVYCSDHGEMAGEHGCWWKSNYYENSVGIPLIARWPEVIAPESRSNSIVNLMDLGPTFAEIAETQFPNEVDGNSLLDIFKGSKDSAVHQETYSEFVESKTPERNFLPSRMIRSGDWKLWVYADDEKLPPALFNLKDDPDELHDLIDDPKYNSIKEQLLNKVKKNWDAEQVLKKAYRLREYNRAISTWGKTVAPRYEDQLILEDTSFEDDVVIY